jgi:hypothetical protein
VVTWWDVHALRHDEPALCQLGSAFQEPGMHVKNVTGIGFTTRWTAQQQRHLPVGHGLFGKVVVNAERVFAAISEILGHRHAGVRREIL